MSYQKAREDIITASPMTTEEGKEELYQYSVRRMEESKGENNNNSLTGLPNLRYFFYLCGEMIKENPDKKFGVIVMDIAQFKAVNEFCGRKEGDRMLKFIGICFKEWENLRPLTYACHLRADNYALCTAYEQEEEFAEIVKDIKQKIDAFPFAYKVLPSFGIAASTESRPSVSYMKDCATVAMNSIKGKYFATYAYFDSTMRKQLMWEKQVENDIVAAMENREIVYYIQPKVDMATGRIVGGEALVRWISPEKGVISPGAFVPILEKNGFIINVDEYIWKQVFEYQGGLKKAGRTLVPISVNVSRVHAYDKNLCDTLCSLRQEYDVPADCTILELTESAFLADEEGMFRRMQVLREQGFKISMDDFGTGYSTMNMLKTQPMDEIKMDRAFILDLENDKSRIILEYTISMLLALNAKIVIEGVETEEQKEFLLNCGCRDAQGFLFYKPMPVKEFDELLRRQEENDRLS
ncbi:MAG: GGDEF domain-containing phosphodiesterase [Bacteroidales bacterium]|nr:GGDEF domain-containing phosphodiesterase [Lachnoclostridium sp.]MCM1383756.1 GGDEF domain-containing phosphodiesterase [Lachnoclostridium sp.]MCM1464384.1 GGDEF domain-containing phosphodiesterase [Bacteroidales bacterium]